MRLLLLAPPGAGKGTQGERLAAWSGARHIAAGDLLRAEARAGVPEPEVLARQLHLLYDGSGQSARMDHDPAAAAAARAAAATLLDAALTPGQRPGSVGDLVGGEVGLAFPG